MARQSLRLVCVSQFISDIPGSSYNNNYESFDVKNLLSPKKNHEQNPIEDI